MVDLPDMETREEILKVTMSMNRVDEGVNFTTIAAKLEGYTGSDIKEVCREAVVRISNEQAKELDRGGEGVDEATFFTFFVTSVRLLKETGAKGIA